MADWEKHLDILPYHMREGMKRYINMGIAPGGFMTAVLSNNFKEAFLRADAINKAHMEEWARYVIDYMPSGAQGSMEKVQDWMRNGGLAGLWSRQERESEAIPPDDEPAI